MDRKWTTEDPEQGPARESRKDIADMVTGIMIIVYGLWGYALIATIYSITRKE